MRSAKGALAALLLAAACFAGAFFLRRETESARPRFKTDIVAGQETLPPVFQLASALLGSFRTLLVDFLWVRAESLQQEGRYFAASQFARWITLLQSRIESGWSFQAWNLGVNVPSVLPRERRWPFVRAALELLWRDALGANPQSLELHHEIGWFWEYRVGGELDPASGIYRRKVMDTVETILGKRPWDLAKFVEAEELLPLLKKDEAVRSFLGELKEAGVRDPEKKWVDVWREPEKFLGDSAAAFREKLSSDPVLEAFDRAMRAAAWRREFGLDIGIVKAAADRYGELRIA